MARKIFEKKYHNGNSRSSVIIEDGKRYFVNKHNFDGAYAENKARRLALSQKSTNYFNSKLMHGDRLIARIPKLALIKHPELAEDDEALFKYLDAHPEFKTIDVGWTRQKKTRGLHMGGIKDAKIKG